MTVRIIIADAREALAQVPDNSVHVVITSPPYFGLRDYGTGIWAGGDPACDHALRNSPDPRAPHGQAQNGRPRKGEEINRRECRCGALRIDHQLGLEADPDEYVEAMVALFREVWRVLRPDGTLWLNLGDSYSSNGGLGRQGGTSARAGRSNTKAQMKRHSTRPRLGFKAKDMVGIPWRVAMALQQDGAADWRACQTIERVRAELLEAYDGEAPPELVIATLDRLDAEYREAKGCSWYLRQDIIWAKPNPMPEAVRDRCTKAHEYFFMLSKSPIYYFDQVAISEPLAASSIARLAQNVGEQEGSHKAQGKVNGPLKAVRKSGNIARKPGSARGCPEDTGSNVCGSIPWEGSERNKRSVWTVATQPFDYEMCGACEAVYSKGQHDDLRHERVTGPKGEKITRVYCACGEHDKWLSHFATFPPALIEPAILAGTSARGCCSACGAPWVREVERTFVPQIDVSPDRNGREAAQHDPGARWAGSSRGTVERKTQGWAPTCGCDAPLQPCLVLDPFGGAGTTGLVADRLQRDALMIELSPRYAKMAQRRIDDARGPLLGLMESAA